MWPDGRFYRGKWSSGKSTGDGEYVTADGSVIKENCQNNNKEAWPEDNYQGTFKKINLDGSVYNGDFVGTKMHGYGELTYADGSIYRGTWKEDKRDGQGTFTSAMDALSQCEQYFGGWKDDKKHGLGVMTYKNGEAYQGEWQDGKKHGEGIYYWLDRKEEGEWVGGTQVSLKRKSGGKNSKFRNLADNLIINKNHEHLLY